MTQVLKKDFEGNYFRSQYCLGCGHWLCDEYIRRGRLKLRCFGCGKINMLVVRTRQGVIGSNQTLTQGE